MCHWIFRNPGRRPAALIYSQETCLLLVKAESRVTDGTQQRVRFFAFSGQNTVCVFCVSLSFFVCSFRSGRGTVFFEVIVWHWQTENTRLKSR